MTLEEQINELHEIALERYKTKANYLIEDYRNALHPVFRKGVQDAAEELEILSALQDANTTEELLRVVRVLLSDKEKTTGGDKSDTGRFRGLFGAKGDIEMITIKTQDEIADLKAQWQYDPCWDIEDTEGFEAHYDELKAYRIETEKAWKEERDRERFEEIDRRATELKCSMELAEYTLILENKISLLQDKVEELFYQSRI